jgi:superfamily II DNA/RNA helicase
MTHSPASNPDPVALDHATSGAPDVAPITHLAARAPVAEKNPLFADLGVRAETVAALEAVGITRAFAIQELALPIALDGHDIIGQARTGTGKTLGFGIPLLERILSRSEGAELAPQALIVVPTRELCVQVADDLHTAGLTREITVLAVYGGRAYEPQIDALRGGVQVVVGTPGRLLDLANQGHLRLGEVKILVLDEADEMLDLGFLPDVEKILAQLPSERQTMLFSATMPGPIITMARQFMRQPMHVRAESHGDEQTVPTTTQFVYRAHNLDKAEVLSRILQAEGRGRTMIFCRTKRTAQRVADDLIERGFNAGAVHGDLNQEQRERALNAFRALKIDVLVATDVAARGIDVPDVTHVVNYQTPDDEKTYLHRIGRTGRAGSSGVAITLVDWDELPRWAMIDKLLGLGFDEPRETYSTSPHLHEELAIPEGTSGRIGSARREPAPEPRRTKSSSTTNSTGEGRRRTPRTPAVEETSEGERTRARRRSRRGEERPAPQEGAASPEESRPEAPESSGNAPRSRRRTRHASPRGQAPEAGEAPQARAQEPARRAAQNAVAQKTAAQNTATQNPAAPSAPEPAPRQTPPSANGVKAAPLAPLFSAPS